MKRCIQLAKNGLGTTYPNPLVGSVIVCQDTILGEGWHYQAGQPHAEVHAITSVQNTAKLTEATMYVSLEPCSHFGKTPPCADLIISTGIKKVVIGSTDPNPKVAGKGIKKLMEAGCDVVVGILEPECNELNKRFFTFQQKKRPFITLKWAQTPHNFIAPKTKNEQKPVWITNPYSRQLVHKWRAEEQAILVGTHTVREDNSGLTTRDWCGTNPLRVVLDAGLTLSASLQIFNGASETLVFTSKRKEDGDNSTFETVNFTENLAQQLCDVLYKKEIQSLIVEGGAKTLQTFIDANLWDEALVFEGVSIFENGVRAPNLSGTLIKQTKIANDVLFHYKNPSI